MRFRGVRSGVLMWFGHSKRGFRPAEGSKVRNLAYNGSPNDFDELILNFPEVLRCSELL